ncbi:flagella basal body P-ring formation protein FlgA [Novosphingobium sp. PhB165]|uniref:flagella basal body P-ring formation protein FlgA n=1 Tax=Novosphingobium sp. PhB165 TaxID=2485105 RepID=UPI0010502980|nr:flagella basal body P-ring formation protein FlgA [Novosphingobium sp. PhB165]TCM18884.1 flagella basal body P-ring formation protein FlgA [Novosphingobium sp. PhB165]
MNLALLVLAAAASGSFADLDAIDRQVAAFTGAGTGEIGGALTPVDRRLRLSPCLSGLALSWRGTGQDSVVVQCGDAGGWRLFVPVRRPAALAEAASAAPVIKRGDAVAIAVSGEGFTVTQPGMALEGGAEGDWIRVRPLSGAGVSTRTQELRAQIVSPGTVALPLP